MSYLLNNERQITTAVSFVIYNTGKWTIAYWEWAKWAGSYVQPFYAKQSNIQEINFLAGNLLGRDLCIEVA